MDVNKVTRIGRLTKKQKCRTAVSGQRTATFTLATSHSWKASDGKPAYGATDLHRVRVWGRLAEIARTDLDRGTRVCVEGRLVATPWK